MKVSIHLKSDITHDFDNIHRVTKIDGFLTLLRYSNSGELEYAISFATSEIEWFEEYRFAKP